MPSVVTMDLSSNDPDGHNTGNYTATLTGDQALHLARVLRAEPGQIYDVNRFTLAAVVAASWVSYRRLLYPSVAALALFGLAAAVTAQAQELEPRTYSNTPVGMNFLLLGYAYSVGDVSFDTSAPIEDGHVLADLNGPRFQAFTQASAERAVAAEEAR